LLLRFSQTLRHGAFGGAKKRMMDIAEKPGVLADAAKYKIPARNDRYRPETCISCAQRRRFQLELILQVYGYFIFGYD